MSALHGRAGGGLDAGDYEALAARCSQVAARLLRRADVVRLTAAVAHLYWRPAADGGGGGSKAVPAFHRPAEVLACLQRCVRVATSLTPTPPGLVVGLAEAALVFFEAGVPSASGR